MEPRNRIIIHLCRKYRDFVPNTRISKIERVMSFYDSFGLFDPVDLEEDDDLDMGTIVFETEVPLSRNDIEARILAKQIELGIVDENTFNEMDDEEPVSTPETTRYGRTELHEAILIGDFDFVKKLVEQGADIYAKDKNGNTPYTLAIIEGRKDISEFLKSYMKK